jgi:creatinine amidohydrolase
MTDGHDISAMTSAAYGKAMESSGMLLIPLASIEVLGTHGPLGADWLVANKVVPRIAEIAGAWYAPTIPYGDTLELPKAPGTVDIPQHVLEQYYESVANSFLRDGKVRHLFFINFHSLNNRAADAVCRKLALGGTRAYVIDWWKTVGSIASQVLADVRYGSGHGGEMITSVLLHLIPDMVDMEQATNGPPLPRFDFFKEHLPGGQSPFSAYGTFADYTDSSSWGDLSGASAEKGSLLVERSVVKIREFISRAGIDC